MTPKPTHYFISHIHRGCEWYLAFEQFRFRLVRLIDNLLEEPLSAPEALERAIRAWRERHLSRGYALATAAWDARSSSARGVDQEVCPPPPCGAGAAVIA